MLLYLIRNNANGKLYVGQTTRSLATRWKWHKHDRLKSRNPIACAIRKYGPNMFSIELLREGFKTQEQLDNAEKLFITVLRTGQKEHGYNVALGGSYGAHSEETKRKISATMKARKIAPGLHVRNLANATRRGSHHNAETRVKMSRAAQERMKRMPNYMRELTDNRVRKNGPPKPANGVGASNG